MRRARHSYAQAAAAHAARATELAMVPNPERTTCHVADGAVLYA